MEKGISDVTWEDDEKKYNTRDGYFRGKHKMKKDKEAELKKMVEKVKNLDGAQIKISPTERVKLFKEHIYNYYEIKDFDNKIYYIKDSTMIKEMDEIMENIYK